MAVKDSPVLPTEEEARAAFTPVLDSSMAEQRNMLLFFKKRPPQVLIFEGGDKDSRLSMALWWAALLHCQTSSGAPCLECPACLRVGAGAGRDVMAYDGGISNKEEEENTGFIRAFNMDNVRVLKRILGQAPYECPWRVVVLTGLDQTREEACNALLKVLEEPSEASVFVLLTPQREQLLPTLVSRGWVITLPWRHSGREIAPKAESSAWEAELAAFLTSGRGWFRLTSGKGAVGVERASDIILSCQRALAAALGKNKARPESALAAVFIEGMDETGRFAAMDILQKSQEALSYDVAPARVMDNLAVSLHGVLRKAGV